MNDDEYPVGEYPDLPPFDPGRWTVRGGPGGWTGITYLPEAPWLFLNDIPAPTPPKVPMPTPAELAAAPYAVSPIFDDKHRVPDGADPLTYVDQITACHATRDDVDPFFERLLAQASPPPYVTFVHDGPTYELGTDFTLGPNYRGDPQITPFDRLMRDALTNPAEFATAPIPRWATWVEHHGDIIGHALVALIILTAVAMAVYLIVTAA